MENEEDIGGEWGYREWGPVHPDACWIEIYSKKHPSDYTGTYLTHYPDGKIHEKIEVVSGKLHGEIQAFYPSGNLQHSFPYTNGVRVSPHPTWYENGKLHGYARIFYDNGNIQHDSRYENGALISTRKYLM